MIRTGARHGLTVIGVVLALTWAGAAPALAQSRAKESDPLICLTNSSAWCIHPYGGSSAAGTGVDIYNRNDSTNGDSWTIDQVGTLDYMNNTFPEYEIKAGSSGECIGLSSLSDESTDAVLTTCGADGTVWIWMVDSDGYNLFSRWWFDMMPELGAPVFDPLVVYQLGNNEPVEADPNLSGDGSWQQWSD